MSYSFSFVPNNVYGAQDINEITKRLVTSGVEDIFEDGVPYNFSHINTISKNISTMGVIPEENTSLKVTNNGKVNDEYTVTIAEGTAFFEDGSTITIYDGGETLAYTYGQKNYVYLHRDLNLNRNMPKVTLTEPEGDYVPLAEIAEDGTVTDKRVFAKGKLPGYMSDYNNTKKIEVTLDKGYGEIDLGGTNHKCLTCFVWEQIVENREDFLYPRYSAMFFINNGKILWNISVDGSRCKISNNVPYIATFKYNSDGSDQRANISIHDGIMSITPANDISNKNYLLDIYVC